MWCRGSPRSRGRGRSRSPARPRRPPPCPRPIARPTARPLLVRPFRRALRRPRPVPVLPDHIAVQIGKSEHGGDASFYEVDVVHGGDCLLESVALANGSQNRTALRTFVLLGHAV